MHISVYHKVDFFELIFDPKIISLGVAVEMGNFLERWPHSMPIRSMEWLRGDPLPRYC